jgi:phosphatidylethanolamine-binding protein (PEBP) family uncharacterized protein
MKTRLVLAALPLLIVGGITILVWRMHVRQRADDQYHAGLVRSIQISSDAFEDQGDMPVQFSCEGEGISPLLRWSNLPAGTKSLVLLTTDADLPTPRLRLFQIVHCVLYNIPSDVAELGTGVTDADLGDLGIAAGPNWSKETRYYPPCPLYGEKPESSTASGGAG